MNDELRRILKQQITGLIPTQVVVGEVIEVSADKTNCDVRCLASDITLHGVRLAPALGASKTCLIVPAKGSLCLVGLVENNAAFNYLVAVQNAEEIILRGGDLGGLVKVEELKAQMEKDSKILRALLNVINGLTIQEPGNGSPSALQLALKTKMANLEEGKYDKIENTKVKHG